MIPLKQLPAWKALAAHMKLMRGFDMRCAFTGDTQRFKALSLTLEGLLLDYSKNRVTPETLNLLAQLARETGVEGMRTAMFEGEPINFTEHRAVLHTALRDPERELLLVDGVNVMPMIRDVQDRMRRFTHAVHSGKWRGHTGKPIKDIVNIGIGGSDLGPAMVCMALRAYAHPGLRVHFVSNLDPTHLASTVARLDPETTLFIIASKTFTTLETLANAHSARVWLLDHLQDETAVAKHFIALSTNTLAVQAFGIDAENMFEFWDWVGGRYSLWSAIGLSIALAVGWTHFMALLNGAHAMDTHFREAPLDQNMPVIMGLLGVWYANFWDTDTYAVFPYDQRLVLLPPFLQQLDMESNGKNVSRNNRKVNYNTGPILWGAPGTNGQHAFFELVHQGTRLIPTDFLVAVENSMPLGDQHEWLLANCLAQTEALLVGKSKAVAKAELKALGLSSAEAEALAEHKVFPGNRPSNTLLYQRLDPYTLGMLIALYEHKVFVQGVVWGINSFDQWGVELGKQLAPPIRRALTPGVEVGQHDGSTLGLIAEIRRRQAEPNS
ncbi:MAG: glucose-6-phosphate isomerase [Thiobacillaceae bacterium]